MKVLFSDDKLFNIDGIYNSQNDRIWVVNRVEVDIRQIRKFLQKIMVWLGVCSKGLSPLAIFGNGTVDHNRCTNEVLLVALNYGNDWTFQQDGAKPHFHEKNSGMLIQQSSFVQLRGIIDLQTILI